MSSSGRYCNAPCLSGYFAGATRTYYWYANAFEDWCKEEVANEAYIKDQNCIGTQSQYKQCLITSDAQLNEQYYTYYYHYIQTKQIAFGSLVNWRDPVSVSTGGPIAFFYCFISNYFCGNQSDLVSDFITNIELYYGYPVGGNDNNSSLMFDEDGNIEPWARNRKVEGIMDPFPYEGFIYDLYGIVGQGPGNILGNFQALCDWCGGGFGPPCVEPWFGWRGFTSTVFTWDIKLGVPYRHPFRLRKFYNENSLDIDLDIKYNHLADEQIFVTGAANWNDGIINYGGTLFQGKYINDPVSNIRYDSDSATITEGTGLRSYVIKQFEIGADLTFRDMNVLSKNCAARPEIVNYPWIHVDIPEESPVEYQQGIWTDVQTIPIDNLLSRALYGWTAWDFYGVGIKIPTIGGSFHNRKYAKKLVKAPHNLYIKSGDSFFQECKYGETLRDLEPGRYYFPNMCYRCLGIATLEPYNALKFYKTQNYEIDKTDSEFYRRYAGTPLVQFEKPGNSDKFANAIELLGLPWGSGVSSIKMESTVTFAGKFLDIQTFLNLAFQIFQFVESLDDPGGPDYGFLPAPTKPS